MRTFREDNQRGLASEAQRHSTLETLVGSALTKDPNPYATFDFFNEGKTIYVELKTRFIPHDKYPTALISANKVEFCTDPNKTYYFCWAYSDGLYYLKYDKAVFDTFQVEDYVRHQREDYNDVPKPHYFIPHTVLVKY